MESLNSNITNDTEYDYSNYGGEFIKICDIEKHTEITGVSCIFICCLSTLGNSLLIYILVRFEDIKKVTMFYILLLAVFDLLFTLTLPFWAVDHLHNWVFGNAACKLLTGIYFIGIYGSLILLTAMTVDRFLAIVVRSRHLTRRRRLIGAKVACGAAFSISLAASLDEVFSSSVQRKGSVEVCDSVSSQGDEVGYFIQLALLFALPLAIIVFCYGKIVHTLMSTANKQKYRTVLVIMCIVVAFFVCWGPYHVLMIVNSMYAKANCSTQNRLTLTFIICRIVAYSHCCVNPMLYMMTAKSRKILSSFVLCSPELRQSASECRVTDPSHSNFGLHSFVFKAKEQSVTELKSL